MDAEPLTGEPLALDLVNTRPAGPEGRTDLLATPQLLAAWLESEGDRLPGPAADQAPKPDDLAPVHAVRAHTEAAVRALMEGHRPPAEALHGLNEAQRAAPATTELRWDGAVVVSLPSRTGSLGVRLAAVLAEAAADLLAGADAGKVRECAAGDCVMLFLPAHPRRQWCSPTRCGNRARVARYYRRHKP
ncbi:CGNR zinc finger domain-containing protein [Streptomyces sp. NPDC002004]